MRGIGPLVLLLVAVVGCASPDPAGGDSPVSVVLITLDTTRADHLGCYGDTSAATPNLDRIAAEGALAQHAVAVAPLTLPSHASLLTGLYPPQHGARDNADFRVPERVVTLAEHLRQQGYATAAVVGSYVLSAGFGLDQGFDTYDEPRQTRVVTPDPDALRHEEILERPASEVTDRALSALSALSEPFFLWVHYFDPHTEYAAPEPFASRFADRPYDGEIAYTDAQLGRLLDALRQDARLDRTLLAVTADHGESLGDHGEDTHGLFVYGATLDVPLLLRFPVSVPAGTRIDRLVSGVDLAPTLLDLLGLPPLSAIEGESFAPALRGESLPARSAAYAEALLPQRAYGWSPLFALQDAAQKFIEAPEVELYNLADDPGEGTNLAGTRAEDVERWRAQMDELRARWPEQDPDASRPLDAAARARLNALGYLSGGGAAPAGGGDRDPKHHVSVHNRLQLVQAHVARADLEGASALLRDVLATDPTNPAALALGGMLLCTSDRCDEGIGLLADASRRSPGVFETQRNLAHAFHVAGRFEQAAETYRVALDVRPFDAETHYALGNALYAQGNAPEAIASYDEAARLGLVSPALDAALGVALRATGDTRRAEASLRRAVADDPGLDGAWNELGIVVEQSGRHEEALGFYENELARQPSHAGALFNVAKVSLLLGRIEPATAALQRLLAEHPGHPTARLLEAQVYFARGDRRGAREALERFLAQPDADPRLIATARQMLARLGG